jgi:hypothetical protein
MKNGHGGPRKGAGRAPGAANRRTREIAEKAAATGLMPLEFMLSIMRGDSPPKDATVEQKIAFHALRFDAAKSAAPYMHPRLAPVDRPIRIELKGTFANRGEAVLAAIGRGELTPAQGSQLISSIAAQARIVEVDELERRISALEQKENEKRDGRARV